MASLLLALFCALCATTATLAEVDIIAGKEGDACSFSDGAAGTCREMADCRRSGGLYRHSDTILRCSESLAQKLVVCCRHPQNTVKAMCDVWKRYWRAADPNVNGECVQEHPLIHGGEEATLGEFPHMVSVGWRRSEGTYKWVCGGSLITPLFVLTAAHCVDSSEMTVVALGEHDLNSDSSETTSRIDEGFPEKLEGMQQILANLPNSSPVEQIIDVESFSVYPDYQRSYHDIALMRLKTPAVLTRRVLPACLPTIMDLGKEAKFTVIGWGNTKYFTPLDESTDSRKLQKAALRNVEATQCWMEFQRRTLRMPPLGITTDLICAGAENKDSCQGDSGGPLMADRMTSCEPREVTGIVSFGPPCRNLGAYTRVVMYLDWITSIVAPTA